MSSTIRKIALAGSGLVSLALAACASGGGKLDIRPRPGSLAIAAGQPAGFRLAEAQGQLALGNVALALEIYRKALREAPDSIAAMSGIAACYDLMGRFDLSRRHYEMALATAPDDVRLYAALAGSLDLQGRGAEAASVRAELAQRNAALARPASQPAAGSEATAAPAAAALLPEAVVAGPVAVPMAIAQPVPAGQPQPAAQPRPVPPPVAVAQPKPVPPPVAVARALPVARPVAIAAPATDRRPIEPAPDMAARSVTIALAPAEPIAAASSPGPAPAAPMPTSLASTAPTVAAERGSAPRLERLSLGEVALVTTAKPLWSARLVERSQRSATIAFVPRRRSAGAVVPANGLRRSAGAVLLLNAARSSGLAAHSRARLAARGWRGLAIGDAARVSATSIIIYPAGQRALARRLARQFRIPLRQRQTASGPITIILGRDAARRRPLAPLVG